MTKSVTKLVLLFLFYCFGVLQLQAQSVGGTTSGAATYCSNINSGFLSLTGYTGSILNWESSTDGGITWTNIGNVTPAQSYFNLSITTCYRAIVQSGVFPPDSSTVSCITIFQPSNGGTMLGGGSFCSISDTNALTLSGVVGSILNWQFSTDGGSTWTTISDTTNSYNYSGLTTSTLFAAVAQNAVCPVDTSTFAAFNIIPGSVGGAVSLSDTVCYLANAGVMNLTGYTGSITGWIKSIDGGLTWIAVADTNNSLPYSSLTQTTEYAALVQNATCPVDTSSIAIITVLAPLPVSAGNDTTIFPGQSVILQGSGTGIPVWTPSTGLDSNMIFKPAATPLLTTNYVLTVTDSNGCNNSDAVLITLLLPTFNGIIATLFTPNGDGINDTWYIQNIANYPDNEVFVYNIYGQQIYYKQNYMSDWNGTYNGKEVPDGTYYYVLKFTKDNSLFKGSVDILRNK